MDLKQAQEQNYYELLGVHPEASEQEIRQVYHDLARVYHPDSNFYDEIVPEKATVEQIQVFKLITAAYNTLTDKDKRAAYDRVLDPLKDLKLKHWEDKDDFWDKNATLSKNQKPPTQTGKAQAAKKRPMTGTFGRAEYLRANNGPSSFEAGLGEQMQPISQIITKRSGRLSLRTTALIGVGIMVGGICLTLVLWAIGFRLH